MSRGEAAALIADLRHMNAMWDSRPASILAVAVAKAPFYPSVRAVFWIRTGMWLWRHHLRLPAHWCKARAVRASGAEIHPGCSIGPGLSLVHTVGIVVGKKVRAGRDLVLHQGVTLGYGSDYVLQPQLGDEVRIGPGASVLGPVKIGDRVRIGAGALVLADVPADTTVMGVWKG